MISFDLKCGHGHVFEVWFRSSADYEAQQAASQIACPTCGSPEIEKAVMAPAVSAKSNQRSAVPATQMAHAPVDDARRAEMHALIEALAQAQTKALEGSQWVGEQFADRVRAMHYGEADHAAVHGTASLSDAQAMIEEGLPVAPLIVPVVPPDRLN